ncbi:MAG: Ig-like domain-containing protein [Coriobacteriia bacterium]
MGRRVLALTVVAALLSGMIGVVPASAVVQGSVPELVSYGDTVNPVAWGPKISDDGRYVAFTTYESLDAADTNTAYDVYRRDRETGELLLLTAPRDGALYPNEMIWNADMSDDGHRFLVQASRDLVPVVGNAARTYLLDVDPVTGDIAITLLGDVDGFWYASLSGDGGTILIETSTSIDPDDTKSNGDIYTYSIDNHEFTWVTRPPATATATGRGSRSADISDDGRYVVFLTGKDLVPEDENAGPDVGQDIYVADLVDGTFRRLDPAQELGVVSADISRLHISGNGSALLMNARASSGIKLLKEGPTPYSDAVWFHDLATGASTLLSAATEYCEMLYAGTWDEQISDDGRVVTFLTEWDLAVEDDNAVVDLYQIDTASGLPALIDLGGLGDEEWYRSEASRLSGDGTALAIETGRSYDPRDADESVDIYAVNLSHVACSTDEYAVSHNGVLAPDAASGVLVNDMSIDGLPLMAILYSGPAHGGVTFVADGSFEYVPDRDFVGEDTFIYLADDGQGAAAGLVRITVTNAIPTGSGEAYDVTGASLIVEAPGVLVNDSDADDDLLSAHKVTGPSHGTLVLDVDGSFLYRPAAGYSGPDSFTYRVGDGLDLSDPVTATLAVTAPPVNTAPIATGDAYETAAGIPLAIGAPGVLGNDTDADDDALSAVKVTGPTDGTLALDADGSFVYIPDAGFAGTDEFTYKVSDGAAYSVPASVTIMVTAAIPPVIEIEGTTRIDTAIAASALAFPEGAKTVVLATAMNWPDALGGGALAGVLDAPVLLTGADTLPQAVTDEIDRLGATDVIIIGGLDAVSEAVQNAIDEAIAVERISGADRYATAEAVAARVISEQGVGFDGTALVATGVEFADALAAAPLAVAQGWPLYLIDPASGLSDASRTALGEMTEVVILGGEDSVSQPVFAYLEGELGEGAVVRLGGADRYATASLIATYAVDEAGHVWDGVGLATGEDFPDALAGGVVQGKAGSVMLLTSSTELSVATRAALLANSAEIDTVRFYGGTSAISQLVRDAVSGVVK